MTSAQSIRAPIAEIIRDAFDVGRAWNRLTPGHGELAFGRADILVIGILVLLRDFEGLETDDRELGDLLAAALRSVTAFQHVTASSANEPRVKTLRLIHSRNFATAVCEEDGVLLYGCRSCLPLTSREHDKHEAWLLFPLSSCSPAFWQSGLVWAAKGDDSLEWGRPLADLAWVANSEWLDPLKLYEQLQEKRDASGRVTADDSTAALKIQALEQRIEQLEHSGLSRHELLASKAAYLERWSS